MPQEWLNALNGGVLIGISVSLMLLFNGRVVGISGILNGLVSFKNAENLWRVFFVTGLLLGGFVLSYFKPNVFADSLVSENWSVILAGALVGFGTVLGSGCTSGHGVCGMSRLSPRSIFATAVFIFSGIVAVVIF